jgi:hypothetical protein
MFLSFGKRKLHYDVMDEGRRIVCFVHALAADSGMWAEQVPMFFGLAGRIAR